MQDMYVGDIGDYGKYGLLRALIPSDQHLGIVWYLIPNEHHLNDGKYIDYLSKGRFKECDPELFSTLHRIVHSGARSVTEIEQSGIFPDHTKYYSSILSYDGISANSPTGRKRRILRRNDWFDNAIQAVKECEVLFLDPDNGLEAASVSKHSGKAPKYVYYDEVERFLSIASMLIVYHHLGRSGSHASQIRQRASTLREMARDSHKVLSLRFRPYSPRAYFIITKQQEITDRLERFVSSKWNRCFELVE